MDPLSLIFFLILILLSMFFSWSETAFTSVPIHKVNALVKEKKSWARALSKLKHNPERMIIAILIWNNIVNTATASLATVISLSIAQGINYEQWTVVTIATIVVTILLLLFWEILPKTFATTHAEKISLLIAPFYTRLIKILYPLIIVIEWLMKGLNKKERKNAVSESDLEAFIELSKQSWIFDHDQDKKIKRLLSLDELTAEDIMTPRIKIKALDDDISLDDAIQELTDLHYSRIPVYHETIDSIDRIVTLKELLRFRRKTKWEVLLSDLKLTPISKIPRSQPIDTLLEKFQKTHKHIAVIVDEYGWVEGIVSLEDIIEEVFGEIQDETDEEVTPIQKLDNGVDLICQSYVRMDELLEVLWIQFEDLGLDDEFESETLSYLLTSSFERFPIAWEELQLPFQMSDENDKSVFLTFKVLWIKKSIIWELEVSVKDENNNKLDLRVKEE